MSAALARSLLFEGRVIDVAMAKAARNELVWAETHGVNGRFRK